MFLGGISEENVDVELKALTDLTEAVETENTKLNDARAGLRRNYVVQIDALNKVDDQGNSVPDTNKANAVQLKLNELLGKKLAAEQAKSEKEDDYNDFFTDKGIGKRDFS
jgi:phage host-nuclease inhibitor protein Gam